METTNNISNYPTATPESVWAALHDLTQKQAETDRLQKETDRLQKESDRQMRESRAEFDREIKEIGQLQKETDRQMRESRADYDERMKKFQKRMGSWEENHGKFAEEYFFNSFEKGEKNFFGEEFETIRKNITPIDVIKDDEYDILLINGKSVGIIEVKFRAHQDHIQKVIRKASTFRENFPKYANHKIYLGLAALSFHDGFEQDCDEQGIAIIKQVGDKVIINQDNIKVF